MLMMWMHLWGILETAGASVTVRGGMKAITCSLCSVATALCIRGLSKKCLRMAALLSLKDTATRTLSPLTASGRTTLHNMNSSINNNPTTHHMHTLAPSTAMLHTDTRTNRTHMGTLNPIYARTRTDVHTGTAVIICATDERDCHTEVTLVDITLCTHKDTNTAIRTCNRNSNEGLRTPTHTVHPRSRMAHRTLPFLPFHPVWMRTHATFSHHGSILASMQDSMRQHSSNSSIAGVQQSGDA
eukprot:Opistho-2@39053